MDAERRARLKTLFHRAERLAPEKRAVWLAMACGDDAELLAEVRRLLGIAETTPQSFLEPPAPAPDRRSSPALEPGSSLGGYRILATLGSGGMGEVYAAEDPRLGRRVALKILPPEVAADRERRRRFEREARALAALDHPNIVTIYSVEDDDGIPFLTMQLVEGRTLDRVIPAEGLPAPRFFELALPLVDAVATAHRQGIVHRDLKPGNVVVGDGDRVRILDFGLAKLREQDGQRPARSTAESLTAAGRCLGTVGYMSPEQATGGPVDARADVFALGVILYQMATGRRPFAGDDLAGYLSSLLRDEPAPLGEARPELPRQLGGIVRRCLDGDTRRRFDSAIDLGRALRDAARAQPPAGLPTRWLPAAFRLLGTRRGWLAGALAAAAIAAVVAVVALLTGGPGTPHRTALRVAVLRPEVAASAPDGDAELVAFTTLEATLSALASLEGLEPLDPPAGEERPGSALEAVRAGEADEVLKTSIGCQRGGCEISFRRLRGLSGPVVAASEPFGVLPGPEAAYGVVEAVRVHLARVYPDHPPRRGAVEPARVRAGDYAAFVDLLRRSADGEALGRDDAARLEALVRTSPGLLGAYVLAAGIHRSLGDFNRGLDLLRDAARLDPGDPRHLFERFQIELAAGDLDAARATVDELARRAPGDVRVESARAELLSRQGRLGEAIAVYRTLVGRRPSWRHLLSLADLEIAAGEVAAARRDLERLLDGHPDNPWGLSKLAELEIQYGDLDRAEAIYGALLAVRPRRSYLSNLGWIHYLAGDYAAAASAYRRALEVDPGSLLARFNLATARDAGGHRAEAAALFGEVLEALAGAPDLDPGQRLLEAHCLARLGRPAEAYEAAERALATPPTDRLVLFQAAQVYALIGERIPARHYSREARKRGLRPEWFRIPEFASLRSDAEFQALLTAGWVPDAAFDS